MPDLIRPPRATYRLQFNPDFTFRDALALVPYFDELGVSHLYSSPILQAVPGSRHGYDVADHSRVSRELGGEAEFVCLAEALHARGMGLLVDIVPNHMAIAGRANPWWWDVLAQGRESPYADFFDVEWEAPRSRDGRILLPVLGDHYGAVLAAGDLRLVEEDHELRVAYHDHRFPLDRPCREQLRAQVEAGGDLVAVLAAISADPDRLDAVLEAQHYRLAFWRAAQRDLDYRRFFDVNELVGLRVEDPDVFEATHATLLRLIDAGLIDGVRVDHIDGLRDPCGYLQRLRQRSGLQWVVVEKILAEEERIPPEWETEGTTGYEFAREASGVLLDSGGLGKLQVTLGAVLGEEPDFATTAHEGRTTVLRSTLASDLLRLSEQLTRICESRRDLRDYTRAEVHRVLREWLASLGVYRTYLEPGSGTVSAADREVLAAARDEATRRDPEASPVLLAAIPQVMLSAAEASPEADFTLRVQQLAAAVMAKGVEDTALYRVPRLGTVNEVGGPATLEALSVSQFHEWNEGRQRRPLGLNALSTHDTKWGADTRARLAVLSECAEEWAEWVDGIRELSRGHFAAARVDPALEYLLLQALVGAHPVTADRAVEFAVKAARESKLSTAWAEVNAAYEEGVEQLVRALVGDVEFQLALSQMAARVTGAGRRNALAQTLWHLTSPGVPDIFQGDELWQLVLVDPDNRRPVDFSRRRQLLATEAPLPSLDADTHGRAKLHLIREGLALRRRRPQTFRGGYRPLLAAGEPAARVVAYLRAEDVLTVAPLLSLRPQTVAGATLAVPAGKWRNTLTGEELEGAVMSVAQLLTGFPVALLERI